jgi:diphthamide biosynthesis methyltransferase
MTVAQAAALLLRMEGEFGGGVCGPEARAIGLARVGHATQVSRQSVCQNVFLRDCR